MNQPRQPKAQNTQWRSGRGMSKGEMSKEQAQRYFPPIEMVDKESGEVFTTYQYKAKFIWKDKFVKDPNKPDYTYPDYVIIMEYFRQYGHFKNTSFREILRSFILAREYRSKEIKIYDNTGAIEGNLLYHSVIDPITSGNIITTNILVNYLFHNRPNFRPHPKLGV